MILDNSIFSSCFFFKSSICHKSKRTENYNTNLEFISIEIIFTFFYQLGNYCHEDCLFTSLHRGAFCQFPFRWIYYYGSNKSTGKETDKTHLCALQRVEMVQKLKMNNDVLRDVISWILLPSLAGNL